MSLPVALPHESLEPVLVSPVEGMFWNLEANSLGAFRVVALFQIDGWIEADHLRVALESLQRRHPKLRAVVARGSDGLLRYEFEAAASPIPFRIETYSDDEVPWREEARQLLQFAFPTTGPFAAVTTLRCRSTRKCVMLLTVHHAIADGLSAIMLMDNLLAEYARAEAGLEAPALPVLPPVTAMRATSTGGWRGRLRLFGRFIRLQREERRARQTALPEVRGIPPQSQWVHWVFSREATIALVRRCRKERTSLNGALVAAVCSALMDCLPISEAVFKCQFPLNLRHALVGGVGPVSEEDLGCFVSIMNEYYEVPRLPVFWDMARKAHEDMQSFAENGGPSMYYNVAAATTTRLFKLAAPKLIATSQQRVTLLATNYGVLNVRDAYGSLRPRGCTLMFKNDVVGPLLVTEALVMGQELNVGFAADGLDPVFWERLQAAVRTHLDAAAGAKH